MNSPRARHGLLHTPARVPRLAAVFLLWFSVAAVAYSYDGSDWGLTINAATTLRYSEELGDTDISNRLRTGLWGELFWNAGDGGSITVFAEGSYVYSDDRLYLFDVDRARATAVLPGVLPGGGGFTTTLGRFAFRDPTSSVLNSAADGIRVGARYSAFEIDLWSGYTGFLLNPVSRVRPSESDRSQESDDDILFGPRRVFALAELRLSDLFMRQQLSLSALSQWDLRQTEAAVNTLDSSYATLLLAGPVIGNLYHTTSVTLSAMQDSEREDSLGMLATTRWRYLREDWLGSRFGVSMLYSSGPDGLFSNFIPLTQPTVGTVYQPRLGNIATLGGSYAVRPWVRRRSPVAQGMELFAAARLFLRPVADAAVVSAGLLTAGTLDPDTRERYLGSEVEWAFRARLLPDLGLAVTGGVYLPGEVYGDGAKPEYLGRFELSIAL